MGYSNLSGSKRVQFENRATRRDGRQVINDALEEMRTENGLHRSDAMNHVALTRRELILIWAVNPDDPAQSMNSDQLDAAVKTLEPLTDEEREQYHTTAFSVMYFDMLLRDLYSMDPDLAELVDDDSAEDYFAHERDEAMI